MNNYVRKSFISPLILAFLLTGCGPKISNYSNEFTDARSNVLNGNVMSRGFGGNVVLDVATAGDHGRREGCPLRSLDR